MQIQREYQEDFKLSGVWLIEQTSREKLYEMLVFIGLEIPGKKI